MSTTPRKRGRPAKERPAPGPYITDQRAPMEPGPPRHDGPELLIRLKPAEPEAVRADGVWLSPGEVAWVGSELASSLVTAGQAEPVGWTPEEPGE